MPIGSQVKDPQGNDLEFDISITCTSGVGDHYTAERTDDPPLYYTVAPGYPGAGTTWKLYCWKFCPFSTQWREQHHATEPDTGNEIELDGYYTTTVDGIRVQFKVTSLMQTDHSGTKGRMAFHQRGRSGFICVDPNCYYYTTTSGYYFQV
jgi:hypothetical protein